MGLDVGASLIIPQVKGGFVTVDVFYFRKCYSLSRTLHEFSLKFKDYAENLEYDGEYGLTLNLKENRFTAAVMLSGMADILEEEVAAFKTQRNEINWEENKFEPESIWDIGRYMNHANSDAFKTWGLVLYLQNRIKFETFLDIIGNYVDDINYEFNEHPENYDLENMKVEFYYSY